MKKFFGNCFKFIKQHGINAICITILCLSAPRILFMISFSLYYINLVCYFVFIATLIYWLFILPRNVEDPLERF